MPWAPQGAIRPCIIWVGRRATTSFNQFFSDKLIQFYLMPRFALLLFGKFVSFVHEAWWGSLSLDREVALAFLSLIFSSIRFSLLRLIFFFCKRGLYPATINGWYNWVLLQLAGFWYLYLFVFGLRSFSEPQRTSVLFHGFPVSFKNNKKFIVS